VAGRIRLIEKFSDLIGNRIRDLPASSIVSQAITLPLVPIRNVGAYDKVTLRHLQEDCDVILTIIASHLFCKYAKI
jgi:hypothetical protein